MSADVTTIDHRAHAPATGRASASALSVGRRAGSWATWRLAARLARREVRRRPGRTVLVALLVLVPVLGMTVASVWVRSEALDDDGWFERGHSAGIDMVLQGGGDADVDALRDRLPVDASVRVVDGGYVSVELIDGSIVRGIDVDIVPEGTEPLRRLADTSGRLPGPGEVWLSRRLLSQFGVNIGDQLALRHPEGSWTVVGTGESGDSFDGSLAMFDGFEPGTFRSGVLSPAVVVDLPPGVSDAAVVDAFRVVASEPWYGSSRGSSWSDSAEAESLAWSWVVGVLALAITGIIVAAAFATSARRQLVTIGLLASNGASPRVIRRSLALQGTWTSAVGALAGVAIGLGIVAIFRPQLDHVRGYPLAGWRISVIDLVVIVLTGMLAGTLAALVPSRSASQVPVMAALAGRRPIALVPRRLVPAGLVLFAVGVVLLAGAAATGGGGNGPAASAVIGGLMVLAGVCCCTPLATDVAARVGSSIGGSWRLAGRSLGRTRTRTAAVVTAIAVTAAGAIAGSIGVVQASSDNPTTSEGLAGTAVIVVPAMAWEWSDGDPPPEPTAPIASDTALPVATIDRLSAAVPGIVVVPRRILSWEPVETGLGGAGASAGIDGENGATDWVASPYDDFVLATPQVVELYRLDDVNRAALQRDGVMALSSSLDVPDTRSVVIADGDGDVTLDVAFPGATDGGQLGTAGYMLSGSMLGSDTFLITPERAAATGLDVVQSGGYLVASTALSNAQRQAIADVLVGNDLATYYPGVDARASEWAVSSNWSSSSVSSNVGQALIIGAALLLTLLVVAIGLSLAATESRDERDVLVAIGARPRTMRSMAGAKAVVMTLAGVLVAIPAGMLPMLAVSRALDDDFAVPWLTLGALTVIVPLMAGAAALAASSIAQRWRPVRMSTLATD